MTMDISTLTKSHGDQELRVKQFDICAHELSFTVVARANFILPLETTVETIISGGGLYLCTNISPEIARELGTALLESAAEAERVAAEAAR